MRCRFNPAQVAIPFTLFVASAVAAADWPNFRGVNHDGISAETGLKVTWNEALPLVWEREIGSAFSSFAAVRDRIYTCGTQDAQQILYCMEADTGKIVWQKAIEGEYRDQFGDGARATPTVHDGKVYILGAHGRLACFDAGDGKDLWSRQLNHKPTWGYAGSVLVEGDLAIVSAGNEQGSLLALNRNSGETVWKCGSDQAGYATPYPFTFGGTRYVVGFTGVSVMVAELKTGRQVLRMPWKTAYDVNAAAPIYHDGHLFLTSGYDTGCALYKLEESGGKLAAEEVWSGKTLINKFQSCILYQGNLYASDQKSFKCVEFATGKQQWEIRRVKHAPLTMADGHLFLLTEDGKLRIGKASPEGFTVLTEANIFSGKCWSVPVLHRGKLYARNLERVACFDLRGR